MLSLYKIKKVQQQGKRFMWYAELLLFFIGNFFSLHKKDLFCAKKIDLF